MRPFWKRKPPPTDLREIIEHFDEAAQDEENFPSTIDPRIYHVQLLIEYFGDLNGRSALDAGSGKGRFSRVLKEQFPQASLTAFDLSAAMLHFVPEGIERCQGSLTSLPFQTAAFDCAFAIESLEHAVDVESAVADLCRVVKAGGQVVVIDKNADHWGRLKTPAWEKWFDRKAMEKLLGRHCQEVSSRPISYWEDVAPDGLFFAWLARK
ncbi:MAG TPA: class I SAM-dependent methyltransferase [Bryobacteraceae bacterium]|nr:class I SAM-dependent methyltransferase [Bryobacteraceae bacterium]